MLAELEDLWLILHVNNQASKARKSVKTELQPINDRLDFTGSILADQLQSYACPYPSWNSPCITRTHTRSTDLAFLLSSYVSKWTSRRLQAIFRAHKTISHIHQFSAMLVWTPSAFEQSLPIAFHRHCQSEHLTSRKITVSWAD